VPEFYRQIDAAIVPIAHGGGIKTKAVEAMAHGVPVFGTPHVASGFSPEWTRYIGEIEQLLEFDTQFPPVPLRSRFDEQFSQSAFELAVKETLTGMERKFSSA
jgi:glycosyltransferase involved in cell wall biosynthesis